MSNFRIAVACAVLGFAAVAQPSRANAQSLAQSYSSLTYRAIGPAIAGGRVTAAAGSDRDPQLYYVGGADGGVFKSTNGGASWAPVFDRQPVAAIGVIAVDPQNSNIVWVGTGEANPRNDAASGDGVWYSRDGAQSWTHAGLDDAGAVSSISIDPRASSTLVVGVLGQEYRNSTTRGIYRTTDGGAHWSRSLFVGPSTGVSDVVRLPRRPATLFAGLWEFRRQPWTMTSGGPSGGIYRSDDGGASWRRLSGIGLPGGLTGRIGLTASGNYVYARIQSKVGFIWRSADGGAHWQRMPASEFVGARGFYFSRVFADPSNALHLINLEGVASVSTNGARSFTQTILTTGYDFHYAWWSSDGRRILVACDEGVVISHDGGAHWVQPYDLPFAQVYHVGLDRVLPYYHVCIGLQDNDSWCAPQSVPNLVGVLNRDWITVAPGDGMWSVFDPLDQNLLWSTETNTSSGQLYLTDFRTGQQIFVSPVARLTFGVAPSAQAYRFNWDAPIAFSSGGAQALVGGNVLFASSDRGQTWKVLSPDLTRDDRAKQTVSGGPIQLDMSDAETYDTIMYVATTDSDPGVIWAGTDDGLVQLTRDGGQHWRDVTPRDMPQWARVMGMDVGHAGAGTVYVAADGHMSGDDRPHLFVTDDFGATWRSISGDLPPDLIVRSIREDPKNPDLLYAGTGRGVWVSFDRGVHWNDMRLNMPASAVYDLEIQPDQNDLVVGTHGRGVWILDDLSPLQQLAALHSRSVALLAPRTAYRMFAVAPINTSIYSPQTSVPDNIFVGQNAPDGAIINYYFAAASRTAPSIDVADSAGRVVRHMTGGAVPNHLGINRAVWNLHEDGPVPWNNSINKGIEPHDGAEAVPGTFTVTLHADGHDEHATVAVKQDPRDPSSFATYHERHDILAQLFAELSGVDEMLNVDDTMHPMPPGVAAIRAQLTNAPAFDEDNISRPPGLRERLLDLISQFSTSFQAPTASQLDEAAALKLEYDRLDTLMLHQR
jgi:photosystem II stability/assembly factor-like uncharacterized protein